MNEVKEEVKIPKPIPLKDFGKFIEKTETFKKYGFTGENIENSDYLLYDDRVYSVTIHNINKRISVFVHDLESEVCSDGVSGPDPPYRNNMDIYDKCKMLSQFIRKQLLQEAKELYLKGK